ncbi:hypothetical protein VTK73DRAFT_725 [Phialemonium thermophilum]|uniref:Uncharacterized protein n=1 Tax=Phialemonium thermophilum TaxID=223376 RepID=A0ABR3VUF0_9PEZI
MPSQKSHPKGSTHPSAQHKREPTYGTRFCQVGRDSTGSARPTGFKAPHPTREMAPLSSPPVSSRGRTLRKTWKRAQLDELTRKRRPLAPGTGTRKTRTSPPRAGTHGFQKESYVHGGSTASNRMSSSTTLREPSPAVAAPANRRAPSPEPKRPTRPASYDTDWPPESGQVFCVNHFLQVCRKMWLDTEAASLPGTDSTKGRVTPPDTSLRLKPQAMPCENPSERKTEGGIGPCKREGSGVPIVLPGPGDSARGAAQVCRTAQCLPVDAPSTLPPAIDTGRASQTQKKGPADRRVQFYHYLIHNFAGTAKEIMLTRWKSALCGDSMNEDSPMPSDVDLGHSRQARAGSRTTWYTDVRSTAPSAEREERLVRLREEIQQALGRLRAREYNLQGSCGSSHLPQQSSKRRRSVATNSRTKGAVDGPACSTTPCIFRLAADPLQCRCCPASAAGASGHERPPRRYASLAETDETIGDECHSHRGPTPLPFFTKLAIKCGMDSDQARNMTLDECAKWLDQHGSVVRKSGGAKFLVDDCGLEPKIVIVEMKGRMG